MSEVEDQQSAGGVSIAVATPPDSHNEALQNAIADPSDAAAAGTDNDQALVASGATQPEKRVVKRIVKRKKRPARPQIDPSAISSEPPPQTGTIFNIWYNKWSGGDREDKYMSKTAAKGRCNIARDSGYTMADRTPGSFFCLFFARGVCPKGQDCQYLHRLPGIHDIFNPNVDCFGRDKHSDYRDDMGGVGSFMRQNRTVYIGRIHVSDDIEEVVARHLAEWGQIERTRVLNSRGVAFVTYTNEANAQFAKEAMAHQSLDHEEILNVRWATADPNPMARAREARRVEEQAAEAVRRALPASFIAEIEGRDPEARKRRRIEGSYGLDGYEAPDEVYFARGPQAVNPAGRTGYALEAPPGPETDEDLLAQIEAHEHGHEQARPTAVEAAPSQSIPQSVGGGGGIFSNSTLAALGSARVLVAAAPQAKAASGPLVAYGSDDDDSE